MPKHYLKLACILSLLILPLLSGSAAATETIRSLQQKVDAFYASSDHQFAPSTAAKARAYLGAAMLADEEAETEKVAEGLARALAVLNEARENARRFQTQYSDLLLYKKAAEQAVLQIKTMGTMLEPDPGHLLDGADASLEHAIALFEGGDLNNAGQNADEASRKYIAAIDAALPTLINETGSIIGRAAAAGAKKYTPQSYDAAKLELSKMEQYADGLSQAVPTQPGYALTLARRSLQITQQVKIWRKSYGSHEELYLRAREDRLKLAEALNIDIDSTDANADISVDELLQAVTRLQSSLTDQKSSFEATIARLKERYKVELEHAVSEQRSALLSDQSEQLGDLKEAFRAKLERETFETKRQKQLRDLFEKGEAELLVNLDGSLLIRLTKLQFSSGSSKVDAAYYALLGKLKEALTIYGERKIRIEGHTDSNGAVKTNQTISLKRAEAVRDFLVAAGMDGSRIKALGYGEVRPVASNEFKKGRAMNRRIDIVIEAQHD
ncbi:MAG: OmpA family protein [Mariprofundaceae bacterium]|nr:OmpA family protein [Mariprofundaceae bacterium]